MAPARSDARANRDALLTAASRLFADVGAGVPLDAIARAAGVSIATLYRHFPNREALVVEVYRSEIDRLGDTDGILRESDTAAEALAVWVRRFIDYADTKQVLGEVIHALPDDERPSARATVTAAITRLLDAGRRDGSLRDDVDADDLLLMFGGVWSLPEDSRRRERVDRLAAFVLEGLRRNA
ncbi:TetR/AcrR family transcriptional regulator [Williamsia deligens]|uniref:TetR/AcrR family transcriptional regulator n=1 Tax=Williamsia deligens TaxID=321325 RepID=A0ABW3G9W4_9NOCA|nr:TetR/AcrR family transcriptional regulator [Williamsia deligens]MCP2192368.1 transcriptional regulator, TetR family [Williamsia deligens]